MVSNTRKGVLFLSMGALVFVALGYILWVRDEPYTSDPETGGDAPDPAGGQPPEVVILKRWWQKNPDYPRPWPVMVTELEQPLDDKDTDKQEKVEKQAQDMSLISLMDEELGEGNNDRLNEIVSDAEEVDAPIYISDEASSNTIHTAICGSETGAGDSGPAKENSPIIDKNVILPLSEEEPNAILEEAAAYSSKEIDNPAPEEMRASPILEKNESAFNTEDEQN